MPKTANTSETLLTEQTTITRADGGTKSGASRATADGGSSRPKVGRPRKYATDAERRQAEAAQARARRAKQPKPPKPKPEPKPRRNLHGCDRLTPEVGGTIGRWTLHEFTPGNSRKGVSKKWRCTCECGREQWVLDLNLRKGFSMGCRSCARKPMDPNLTRTATQSLMSAFHMWAKVT